VENLSQLSKEEIKEYQEEQEHYEQQHVAKKKAREEPQPDYEEERDQHERKREKESRRVSDYERQEMQEEVEYHEKTHPAKGKTPAAPNPNYEQHQPGHGMSNTLSPFEINEYREELEYRHKTSPERKSKGQPLSQQESWAIELGWEKAQGKTGKNLPHGMLGYDLETDYYRDVTHRHNPFINPVGTITHDAPIGPQRSRTRNFTDNARDIGRGILSVRDSIYGYRRVPAGEFTNEWRLDQRSVARSHVGQTNFFGGNPFAGMDPFGLRGTTRSSKKKSKRSSRGSDSHSGIPDSIAWMF
jgi:hypothetical protein